MPAPWIDLLLRIDHTLDQADADLNASDRDQFLARVFQLVVTRREQPPFPTSDHPNPGPVPTDLRDPSGD